MNEVLRSCHGQTNKDWLQTTPPARPGDLPRYVPPQVISYSSEEILERLGPAQTQSKPPNTGLNFGIPDEGMPGAP